MHYTVLVLNWYRYRLPMVGGSTAIFKESAEMSVSLACFLQHFWVMFTCVLNLLHNQQQCMYCLTRIAA